MKEILIAFFSGATCMFLLLLGVARIVAWDIGIHEEEREHEW